MIASILFDFLAYHVGYLAIKLFTAGRYPKAYLKDGGNVAVEIAGVAVILAIAGLVYSLAG
jgi:hypothetical protein